MRYADVLDPTMKEQTALSIFDVHVHTVKGSSDSSLTPQELMLEARRIGLDGVCLTEHGGGWDQTNLERVFQDAGFAVVRGLEVATDMGHVLVFGIHSYVAGMHRAADLRKVVTRMGGFMVSAHPFRNLFNSQPYNSNILFKDTIKKPKTAEEAAQHPLFQLVDDIEVANGSNTELENLFSLEVASKLGFTGIGGSDVHSTHGLGKCTTIFEGDILSESDFIEALRAKAYVPAQGFHLGQVKRFGSSL